MFSFGTILSSGNQPRVKNKTIGVTALGLQALGLSALGLSALGLSGTDQFSSLSLEESIVASIYYTSY